MRNRSLFRCVVTALLTATLLAPLACGEDKEKHRKECAVKCEEEAKACINRHEKECGERAKKCAEECGR
jgi:hypothetical protein